MQSLNAKIGELVQRTAENGIVATLRLGTRAVWIAVVAILFAVVIMFAQPQIEREQIPELTYISRFIGAHFKSIVWMLIIFTLGMWIVTTDFFVRRRLFRDILEASNVRRRGAIYLILAATIIILVLANWIGFAALTDILKTITDLWNGV